MRTINEEQLKKILSSEMKGSTYFIFGDEPYLVKHYCSQILNRFDDGTSFNLQKFDTDSDPQLVYNAVCQLPFLSAQKCVSLCDADFEDMDNSSIKVIQEAIKSAGEHCVFLIWFCSKECEISKEKTKQIIESIENAGGIICRLDRKNPAEISRILCNGAAKRGCHLDMATAKYLIEQCSDDLTNLVTELDKLCAFVGKNGNITPKDIDKVCIRTIDVKAYQLGSAITSGKTDEAISLLDDLLYMNYANEMILGAIISPFADIIRIRLRKDRSLGDVAADFSYGRREFILKNALSASNKLDDKMLDTCIKALNDCDAAIKSSALPPRIALEQLTMTLCAIMGGRQI